MCSESLHVSRKLINFVRCIQLARVRGVVVVMESRKRNLTKVENRTETVRRTLDSLLLLCLSVCGGKQEGGRETDSPYLFTFHLSSYVHVHVRKYIHTYIQSYTHTHAYIHTYIHTYTHTHTYIHIHTQTYIHTYKITYTHILSVYLLSIKPPIFSAFQLNSQLNDLQQKVSNVQLQLSEVNATHERHENNLRIAVRVLNDRKNSMTKEINVLQKSAAEFQRHCNKSKLLNNTVQELKQEKRMLTEKIATVNETLFSEVGGTLSVSKGIFTITRTLLK